MNNKYYIVETHDLNFNCEYIEDEGETKRFKKDAPCKRCKNQHKCKIYVKDHNQRMHRKMVANIGKWEKREIKEEKIEMPDPEVYLYHMGMNGLFDEKKTWSQRETIYLDAEWVRLGRKKRVQGTTQQISKKLEEAIKAGNIKTLTLEDAQERVAKESNKERIQKKLKALGGKVPTLEVEIK